MRDHTDCPFCGGWHPDTYTAIKIEWLEENNDE